MSLTAPALAAALLLASLPCAAEEAAVFRAPSDGSAELAGAMGKALDPAYRVAEEVSDGVFGAVRAHILKGLFPGRLSRGLAPAPERDSSALFQAKLQERESRYFQRLREGYPRLETGRNDPDKHAEWRSWAAEEQSGVVVDALRDTLTERYGLKVWGREAEDAAKDRRSWDPATLAAAGVVGGSFLYLNGLHTTADLWRMRVSLDLRSGLRLQQAMQNGDDARRMAGVELGYKKSPVALAAEWGVDDGRLRSEQVGVKYRLRY